MSDVKSLVERLHMAQIASCTCMTKSPDTTYHAEDCRYRVLEEAADLIEQQAARIAALESENRELSEFVIAVGGFWGNSKSKLVGEGSLAEVINRGFKEAERYRWIKSKATRGDTGWMYFYHLRTVDIPISQPRATLDEAIDAAIGAKESA